LKIRCMFLCTILYSAKYLCLNQIKSTFDIINPLG